MRIAIKLPYAGRVVELTTGQTNFLQRFNGETFELINMDTGAPIHRYKQVLKGKVSTVVEPETQTTIVLTNEGVCNVQACETEQLAPSPVENTTPAPTTSTTPSTPASEQLAVSSSSPPAKAEVKTANYSNKFWYLAGAGLTLGLATAAKGSNSSSTQENTAPPTNGSSSPIPPPTTPSQPSTSSNYITKNAGIDSLLSNDEQQSHWLGDGASAQAVSLTYAFQNAGAKYYEGISSIWTQSTGYTYSDTEKKFIRSVFAFTSEVANIKLTESTSQSILGADIRLFKDTAQRLDVDKRTLAYAYQPEGASPKQKDYMGNVFFVSDSYGVADLIYPAFTKNYSDEMNTIAHEIGHALGLDHPFNDYVDGGGYAEYSDKNNSTLVGNNRLGQQTGGAHDSPLTDTLLETIMTYNNPNKGYYTGALDYPTVDKAQTFAPWKYGIYDIAALQHLYGANMTTRVGDTTYRYKQSEPVFDTIWDAGGNDTIVHEGQSAAYISLLEGTLSRVGAIPGWQIHVTPSTKTIAQVTVDEAADGTVTLDTDKKGFIFEQNANPDGFDGTAKLTIRYTDNSTEPYLLDDPAIYNRAASSFNVGIAFGVTIEHAIGGEGNDTIIGNNVANQITGGAGNDTLTGGAGADQFLYASVFGNDTITDFQLGQDHLIFPKTWETQALSFNASILTVPTYGSILLTGVSTLTPNVDYWFI